MLSFKKELPSEKSSPVNGSTTTSFLSTALSLVSQQVTAPVVNPPKDDASKKPPEKFPSIPVGRVQKRAVTDSFERLLKEEEEEKKMIAAKKRLEEESKVVANKKQNSSAAIKIKCAVKASTNEEDDGLQFALEDEQPVMLARENRRYVDIK